MTALRAIIAGAARIRAGRRSVRWPPGTSLTCLASLRALFSIAPRPISYSPSARF